MTKSRSECRQTLRTFCSRSTSVSRSPSARSEDPVLRTARNDHLLGISSPGLFAVAYEAPIDFSDIPPVDDKFFAKAIAVGPPDKHQLTIRLDAHVLTHQSHFVRGYGELIPSVALRNIGKEEREITRRIEASLRSRPAHA